MGRKNSSTSKRKLSVYVTQLLRNCTRELVVPLQASPVQAVLLEPAPPLAPDPDPPSKRLTKFLHLNLVRPHLSNILSYTICPFPNTGSVMQKNNPRKKKKKKKKKK